ncbi:MAG: glycerate kinase [Elusimicrobia bacterium]|nr:glycerate kinase [Elusimicrobiota bacterium]
MKILVAPNSFKESLNSIAVAKYISQGLKKGNKKLTIKTLPLADGGTGTCEILTSSMKGKFINLKVSGPLTKSVVAKYGIIKDTAIIELAESCGLKLVPPKLRNPLLTTTKGVGELILDAVNKNCKKIILGIGDSATIDCGVGALSVLGIKFLNKRKKSIELNARGLLELNEINAHNINQKLRSVTIIVASDVTNPLTGINGALMFAKQKGATEKMMLTLDKCLKQFKKVLMSSYKVDIDKVAGSGAAGGIGGALKVIMNAEISSGFEILKDTTHLEEELCHCDLIITGEGKIDSQTLCGKTVRKIVDLARKHNKPVICITGSIAENADMLYSYGVKGIYSIVDSPMNLSEAFLRAPKLIKRLSESIGRTISISRPFESPKRS